MARGAADLAEGFAGDVALEEPENFLAAGAHGSAAYGVAMGAPVGK
jgi:hypothetical protein